MTQPYSSAANPAAPTHPEHEVRRRIFAIVSASSGNLVEWFDFYVYAFTAIYFSSQFFPKADQTVQLLQAALVFAAGFLMRPLGGWLFGRIADRYGRRNSMLISVLMMCGGSLIIAVLPTYSSIGLVAPLLLLLARMIQGLSVGGEYGTSATYMSEVALQGKRGFYSSFQYVTLIGGQLLASLVLVILQANLSDAELKAWGWRIPFFIGAITALISLYLRKSLTETSTAETRGKKEAGTLAGLWKHKRAFFTVIAFTAGGSLIFYTFTTYMQKYLINTAGMDKKTASLVSTSTLFVYMCLQPLFGLLSDKIGRKKSMILFGLLATLTTVPVLTELSIVKNPYAAFFLIIVSLSIVSLYTSISGLIKAEMFPTEVRAIGVGLSYGIANAIFGGSAEAVALQLKSMGSETYFFWYVTFLTCISFLVSLWMPDSSKVGYLVRARAGGYKLNFDLHRAGGLWVWGVLLIVAFTSFSLNLYREVFYPMMSLVSTTTPGPFETRTPTPLHQPVEPAVGWPELLATSAAEAKRRGWQEPLGNAFYSDNFTVFGVSFFEPGMDHEGGGMAVKTLYYDGKDGRLLGDKVPWQGSAADIFVQLQFPLHSGRILGMPGRILMSVVGLLVAMLSVTGVYIWWKKRRARRAASLQQVRMSRPQDYANAT